MLFSVLAPFGQSGPLRRDDMRCCSRGPSPGEPQPSPRLVVLCCKDEAVGADEGSSRAMPPQLGHLVPTGHVQPLQALLERLLAGTTTHLVACAILECETRGMTQTVLSVE
ncbi:hypothetical protein MRX96_000926 [Rhipicephalus microplus]